MWSRHFCRGANLKIAEWARSFFNKTRCDHVLGYIDSDYEGHYVFKESESYQSQGKNVRNADLNYFKFCPECGKRLRKT